MRKLETSWNRAKLRRLMMEKKKLQMITCFQFWRNSVLKINRNLMKRLQSQSRMQHFKTWRKDWLPELISFKIDLQKSLRNLKWRMQIWREKESPWHKRMSRSMTMISKKQTSESIFLRKERPSTTELLLENSRSLMINSCRTIGSKCSERQSSEHISSLLLCLTVTYILTNY